jgi:hypothetical protein
MVYSLDEYDGLDCNELYHGHGCGSANPGFVCKDNQYLFTETTEL